MAPAANATMNPENHRPRLNPVKMLITIRPNTNSPPMASAFRIKEKSAFVMKTVAVRPATSRRVMSPAVNAISWLPVILLAI